MRKIIIALLVVYLVFPGGQFVAADELVTKGQLWRVKTGWMVYHFNWPLKSFWVTLPEGAEVETLAVIDDLAGVSYVLCRVGFHFIVPVEQLKNNAVFVGSSPPTCRGFRLSGSHLLPQPGDKWLVKWPNEVCEMVRLDCLTNLDLPIYVRYGWATRTGGVDLLVGPTDLKVPEGTFRVTPSGSGLKIEMIVGP